MSPKRNLTDKEVGAYLVYRMKLNELMHLQYLFHHLRDGGCGDSVDGINPDLVSGTVRTCAMAWFCTLLDRNGLNIFDIWTKMFPQYARRIAIYRGIIEPELDRLRAFRDRSAFHAEISFLRFFKPRVDMQEHSKQDVAAIQHFLKLAIFLLKREHTADPDLQSRILDVLLDTELKLDCRIRRQWFLESSILDRCSLFGLWRFS